jgi:hypothetical protein
LKEYERLTGHQYDMKDEIYNATQWEILFRRKYDWGKYLEAKRHQVDGKDYEKFKKWVSAMRAQSLYQNSLDEEFQVDEEKIFVKSFNALNGVSDSSNVKTSNA